MFIGEILHCVAVRGRITGTGNLRLFLHSLDEEDTVELDPVAMQATTGIEPTKIANFGSQRIQLEFRTTEIDERFLITKLYVFIKPTATGYPIT